MGKRSVGITYCMRKVCSSGEGCRERELEAPFLCHRSLSAPILCTFSYLFFISIIILGTGVRGTGVGGSGLGDHAYRPLST